MLAWSKNLVVWSSISLTPDLLYNQTILSVTLQYFYRESSRCPSDNTSSSFFSFLPNSIFVLSVGLITDKHAVFFKNSAITDRAALTPTFAQRSLPFSSQCMSLRRLTANDEIRASGFLTPVRARVLRPRGAAAEQMCGKICYSS